MMYQERIYYREAMTLIEEELNAELVQEEENTMMSRVALSGLYKILAKGYTIDDLEQLRERLKG